MALAWLLTVLALAGIATGVLLGQARLLSSELSAAGGGLLAGIAVFWLMPEIAHVSRWPIALLLAIAAAGGMLALDRLLGHTGHSPRHGVIWPLLVAAAVHSFIDGWSVRAFSGESLAHIAVPLGLALHKVPEGLALGWVTHRSLASAPKSIAAGAAIECATLLGAFIEPRANRSGIAEFGAWWTVIVLAILAGSFLFLGCHALWPEWRRRRVLLLFVIAFAAVGVLKR